MSRIKRCSLFVGVTFRLIIVKVSSSFSVTDKRRRLTTTIVTSRATVCVLHFTQSFHNVCCVETRTLRKNADDSFNHLHKLPQCDGRTNGQTRPPYASHREAKMTYQ